MLRKGHDVLYKAPTMEERRQKRLRGEGDKIKFINLRLERWQVVRFGKGRGRQNIPCFLGMHDHLWDRNQGFGSEIWKGFE